MATHLESESSTKREIDEQVRRLVGLPLRYWGRAADMATLGFGEIVNRESSSPRSRGKLVEVPEFALHIQCHWRIVRDGGILVGYADWQWPPAGSAVAYLDFDAPDAPRNRRDDLVDAFVGHGAQAHIVEAAVGAMAGDLRLEFADECVLEVVPDYATQDDPHDEYWRLLLPDEGPVHRHFVVTAHGLET